MKIKRMLSTLGVLLISIFSVLTMVSAAPGDEEMRKRVNIAGDTFKKLDATIKSTQILYGVDECDDFLLINLKPQGYAIYLKETMELMEYSLHTDSPYKNADGKNLYAGPMNYLSQDKAVRLLTYIQARK